MTQADSHQGYDYVPLLAPNGHAEDIDVYENQIKMRAISRLLTS